MKNKTALVIIVSVCALVLVLGITASTYAYWTSSSGDSDVKEVTVTDTNPSAKYQVFAGYAVTTAGEGENPPTVEYFAALTEYFGLYPDVTILSEATVTVGEPATSQTVPVTKIICSEDLFLNNEAITTLVIPDTITHINENAFRNMTNLKTVVFLGNVNNITFGANVFMQCESLTIVYDVRGEASAATCVSNIKTRSANSFKGTPKE